MSWRKYRKSGVVEMRPYRNGEDLAGVSVSKLDNPETDKGFIARDPQNPADRWYISASYHANNYEPVPEGEA